MLASIVPMAGTIKTDKEGIVKKLYEPMLVDDTRTTKSLKVRMRDFGTECGSFR